MDCEQFGIASVVGCNEHVLREIDPPRRSAALEGVSPTSPINENLPHCLGRCGKEVRATIPLRSIRLTNQFQIGFVNQSGRIQRMPRRLGCHSDRSNATQLAIDERKEIRSSLSVTGSSGVKEVGEFSHLCSQIKVSRGFNQRLRRVMRTNPYSASPACPASHLTPARVWWDNRSSKDLKSSTYALIRTGSAGIASDAPPEPFTLRRSDTLPVPRV